MSRIDEDGTYTILADRFHDLPFNSPNDMVVKSDGMIYFTDPLYGFKREAQELSFQGVFLLNPNKKKLELLVDDFNCPNGLAFSQDEMVLYISDSSLNRRHIRVFDVKHDGILSNSHVFAEIRSELLGNPDGIKMDIEGHL